MPTEQIPQLTDLHLRAASVMGDKKALQVMFIGETPGAEMPIEEILEIFVRVNSGGLVLQKSDLLMSLLDLKWNEVQPELQTLVSEINAKSRYNFTRDDVLKSLLIAAGSETRFDRLVADRDRLEELAGEMPDHLPGIRHAWNMLIIILNDECRIYSERFFRGGHNALLPFVNWLRLNPAPRPGQRKDLVTAIYIAIMSGVFASAEARMGKFVHDQVQARHEVPLRALTSLVTRYSGAVTFDQLCARHLDLALNIAHNGITLDGNPDELQRDHIFPRSTLEQQGKPPQLVHHYANFHFLRATDNLNKSNVPPDKWFRNPGRDVPPYTDQDLKDRLLTWELLESGMFETMIQVRSAKIRERAAQLLGRSMEDFEALFGETVFVPQVAVVSEGEAAPGPAQGARPIRQELGAVVEMFDRIAPSELRTQGSAFRYRKVRPPEWPVGFKVHYEFTQTYGWVGVELHLENSNAARLAPKLGRFSGTQVGPNKISLEWDPKWSSGRGRLMVRFDVAQDPEVVAKTMLDLINQTRAAVVEIASSLEKTSGA